MLLLLAAAIVAALMVIAYLALDLYLHVRAAKRVTRTSIEACRRSDRGKRPIASDELTKKGCCMVTITVLD